MDPKTNSESTNPDFFFFFDKNNITTNKKNHYTWACSTEKQQKKTRETKLVKPVKLGQFVKIQD